MKRAIRITLLVLVALFAAHLVSTLVPESRYEDALDRIRAAEQPVLPRDLATEPIPDAENLAVGLREASEVGEEAVWLWTGHGLERELAVHDQLAWEWVR